MAAISMTQAVGLLDRIYPYLFKGLQPSRMRPLRFGPSDYSTHNFADQDPVDMTAWPRQIKLDDENNQTL